MLYVLLLIYTVYIGNDIFSDEECKKWKEDKWGCKGNREYLLDIVMNKIEDIKKLNDTDFYEIFGKPDKEEKNILKYYISKDNYHCMIEEEMATNIYLLVTFENKKVTDADVIMFAP